MDEASRLISELQLKLKQLDHKIWLYRQDMASEFKKYTEDLLRDVPGDVSNKVNNAVAECLKDYPSLEVGSQLAEPTRVSANQDTMGVHAGDSSSTPPDAASTPMEPDRIPGSPLGSPQSTHEREKEFQGLFTPSYLPLLDSTDRNERRPSSTALLPAIESEAIDIPPRERATASASPTVSSAPSSWSSPLRKAPTPPRRRNTDEASIHSDQSDTPVRRSALRQNVNTAKLPQSPRHVRFEFAGEEFPTTSSPDIESPALDRVERVPIILGNGENPEYGASLLEEEEVPESPPRKRVSSSEALRALSRGPVDDDGTQWTEVRAPPDGSPSVPKEDGETDDSEEDDSLTMRPMTVREAAAHSNGHERRSSSPKSANASGSHRDSIVDGSLPTKDAAVREEDDSPKLDAIEEEGALADLAPLQLMKAFTPMTTMSAAELQDKYVDKSKTVATKTPSKALFSLAENSDLMDLPGYGTKLDVKNDGDDDEELFAFDEATDRPLIPRDLEPDLELESPVSDHAEEPPDDISKYATSPARGILKPGTLAFSTPASATIPARSTSNRSSSYHPFNTPIVSEAIHAQAASLGHVQSFVGSIKDGLDEDALQSFKASLSAGVAVGSLRGGEPRSMSERMAFEDAMEAQREAEGRKR